MHLPLALVASVYGVWLLYAAGPKYLLLSALLYAPGAAVFAWARKDRSGALWQPQELVLFVVLCAGALWAAVALSRGSLSL
jgi:arginine:ornithine antiporter/lysine permease